MQICISSGHGLYVRGASGIIDEVDEARLVVEQLAGELDRRGIGVKIFHDNTSKDQSTNLATITNWHNSHSRDLDISVHFNAYEQVDKPMGCEVLYLTQQALAADLSAAIAQVGFINRGAKKRTDLYVLNNTTAPAVLLEVCFVDSEADCDIYAEHFDEICSNIAWALGGDEELMPPQRPPETSALFTAYGTCSHFGGPDDMGVSASEGLAFHYEINDANQHLFLPLQPAGTSGLARRLNPHVHYIACRWDYDVTSKTMLAGPDLAMVRAPLAGTEMTAFPADWGPHEEKTGRAADLSPGLLKDLGIETDDEVEVIYPWRAP